MLNPSLDFPFRTDLVIYANPSLLRTEKPPNDRECNERNGYRNENIFKVALAFSEQSLPAIQNPRRVEMVHIYTNDQRVLVYISYIHAIVCPRVHARAYPHTTSAGIPSNKVIEGFGWSPRLHPGKFRLTTLTLSNGARLFILYTPELFRPRETRSVGERSPRSS